MEKLDLQRFAMEEQGTPGTSAQESGAAREYAEQPGEKTAFRQMIEGAWREEYEDAVGQRIQAAVQQRFRNQQDWKKQAEELAPLAEALGARYGLDKTDVKAITERLQKEQAGEDRAAPGDRSMMQKRQEGPETDGALRRHFAGLKRQAEELKRSFPDFDIAREMQNPAFVRMTAPDTGVSVRDAYYALHGDAIRLQSMRFGAYQAGQRIASSIQSGASRPVENGMEKPGETNLALDIRNMDRQTREAYRRRIRSGEHIDFVKNI